MRTRTLLPAALLINDLLEVVTGRWEPVTAAPETDVDGVIVDGVIVHTKQSRLVISPAVKLRVRRAT